MRYSALLALMMLFPATATASVHLGASCSDGTVHITVSIFNYDYPDQYQGIVIERSWVGACDMETIITAEPLPLPPQMQEVVYSLSEPAPEDDHYFGYRAFVVDDQGNLEEATPSGDQLHYDYAACGNAIASRGFLTDDPAFNFIPCPNTCWYACEYGEPYVSLEYVPIEEYEQYINTSIPVDIYGQIVVSGMPVPPCMIATHIEASVGGDCAPATAQQMSWSTLKSHYR